MGCLQSDDSQVGARAWPAGGGLGLARLRVRVSRVRVSRDRLSRVRVMAWPKCKRPSCRMPTE